MRKSLFAGLIAAVLGSAIFARADGVNIPAPSWTYAITSLGTSVATALGINVGTTGSVLVKGTSVCADLSNATGACSATYVAAGAWTPADNSGASLTFTSVSSSYNRIGNMVWIGTQFNYPVTANGSLASISGLPVAAANANYAKASCSITSTAAGIAIELVVTPNTSTASFLNAVGAAGLTNAQLSTALIVIGCWYPAS